MKTSCKSQNQSQNQWRMLKVEGLFAAIADDEAAAIEMAEAVLMTPASSPYEYGFRVSDYRYYADRYKNKIYGWDREDGSRRYGLQETLSHKTRLISKINLRLQTTHGEAVKKLIAQRSELYSDIADIRERITVYLKMILHLEKLYDQFNRPAGRVDVQPTPTQKRHEVSSY